MGVRSTSHVPSAYTSGVRVATSSARRVLPAPPTAVRVTRRFVARRRSISASSVPRPTNLVSWRGRLCRCPSDESAVEPIACSCATHAATWERELKPSLLKICLRCHSAVRRAMKSLSATSRSVSPSLTSRATCNSRAVSPISSFLPMRQTRGQFRRQRTSSRPRSSLGDAGREQS